MGLFCLPLGKTKREHIKSLICNAQMWLDHDEKGWSHNDMEYLLGCMQLCLDEATKAEK